MPNISGDFRATCFEAYQAADAGRVEAAPGTAPLFIPPSHREVDMQLPCQLLRVLPQLICKGPLAGMPQGVQQGCGDAPSPELVEHGPHWRDACSAIASVDDASMRSGCRHAPSPVPWVWPS